MSDMPATPGEIESNPSEDQGIPVLHKSWFWWAVILVWTWLILSTLYYYWHEDDEFRLKILQRTIRFLHCIARIAGTFALDMEHQYNDYCELLH